MPILTKIINNYIINGKICNRNEELNLLYPVCQPINIPIKDVKLLAPHSKTIKCDCKCDKCGREYKILLHRLTLQEINNNYILCNYCKGKITNDRKTDEEKQQIKEKFKQTSFERYGVDNISKSPIIREKVKQTNLKKYGYETPFQSPVIRAKIQKTQASRTLEQKQEIKEKVKETSLKRYGVDNASKSPIIQEKIKQTNLKRYGVENGFASEEIKEKIKQTNLKRYGVEIAVKAPLIKEKIEQTNLKRYGAKNVFASEEIKEKIKQTNLERYGVEHIAQLPDIIEKRLRTYNLKTDEEKALIHSKIMQSRYNNQSIATSVQQIYFYNLFNGQLNYPLNHLSLDIALLTEKIDIEYNGGGHNLHVKLNGITQEEFDQREIKRNKFIKSQGWKQIFIISPNDKIKNYTDEEYVKIIEIAKLYLLNTTHHWVNIYIEENKFETSIYTQTITNILNISFK